MKKRVLALLLAVIMLLSVCACSRTNDDESEAGTATIEKQKDTLVTTPEDDFTDTSDTSSNLDDGGQQTQTPADSPAVSTDTPKESTTTEHTVTFDFGYDSKTTSVKTNNGKVSRPAAARAGYTLSGWYNGSAAFDFGSTVSSDITLTAKWEQATYTIEYLYNGGSAGGANPTTYKMGDTVTISGVPVRDGYIFKGWYIDSAENAQLSLTLPAGTSGNIMVRAVWEEKKLYLGTYEQDNNTSNGAEQIEWVKLTEKDGMALLVSKYALDCLPFHQLGGSTSWAACSLRSWLNTTFYKSAFSADEQALIKTVTNSSPANTSYPDTAAGPDTEDNVFLLSYNEVIAYIEGQENRVCYGTPYAISRGCVEENNAVFWWTRSPGASEKTAFIYNHDGKPQTKGAGVDLTYYGVRPAIWVDISAIQ